MTRLCQHFAQLQAALDSSGGNEHEHVEVVRCTGLARRLTIKGAQCSPRNHDAGDSTAGGDGAAEDNSDATLRHLPMEAIPAPWVTFGNTLFINDTQPGLGLEDNTTADVVAVANALATFLRPDDASQPNDKAETRRGQHDAGTATAMLKEASRARKWRKELDSDRALLALQIRGFLEDQLSQDEHDAEAGSPGKAAPVPDDDQRRGSEHGRQGRELLAPAVHNLGAEEGAPESDPPAAASTHLVPPWEIGLPAPPTTDAAEQHAQAPGIAPADGTTSTSPPSAQPHREHVAFNYLSRTLPRFGLRNWLESRAREQYVNAGDTSAAASTTEGRQFASMCDASQRGWAFEYDDALGLLSQASNHVRATSAGTGSDEGRLQGWSDPRRRWLIGVVDMAGSGASHHAFELSASELSAMQKCSGSRSREVIPGYLMLFVAGDAVVGASAALLDLLGGKLVLQPRTFAAVLT